MGKVTGAQNVLEGEELGQDPGLTDSRGQVLSAARLWPLRAAESTARRSPGRRWGVRGGHSLLSLPSTPGCGPFGPLGDCELRDLESEAVASLLGAPDPQTVWDVLQQGGAGKQRPTRTETF